MPLSNLANVWDASAGHRPAVWSLFIAGALAGQAVGQDGPPANFTVAFIGDQGLGSDAEAVLTLILNEGAEAVVHSGDFDYHDDPMAWDDQISGILGDDFPYFASVGNHDDDVFYGAGGYQEFLEARMSRAGIPWAGDLGVRCAFSYQGIFFVLTAPDIYGDGDDNYDIYIADQLASDDSTWRISSWHKNMRDMQVGGKSDETGWGVYEASRRGGAIIATAHEHSYSRTHLLSSCENQTVASDENTLLLARDDPATPQDEGRSFVFVSGLGGKSIRDQERDGPWWASIYTSDQDANHGALFGTFNVDGNPCLAYFYFKNIDGVVIDDFFVQSPLGSCGDGGFDPTGQNMIWLMNGPALDDAGLIPTLSSPHWFAAGTGDFDGNDTCDILWRNASSGVTSVWLMDGTDVIDSGPLTPLNPSRWLVAGTGDFDGDGNWDLLWRNIKNGKNSVWLMDGTDVIDSGPLTSLNPSKWFVAGTGDFDGNGAWDILWRNLNNGINRIWFMDGTNVIASGRPPSVNPSLWFVAGTGDFDGDGNWDILWRNVNSGINSVWLMDGPNVIGSGHPPSVNPSSWFVAGTGDFDGNGNWDILWRKVNNGINAVWLMDGPNVIDSGRPPSVNPSAWFVAGTGDFDGSGECDILWRHH